MTDIRDRPVHRTVTGRPGPTTPAPRPGAVSAPWLVTTPRVALLAVAVTTVVWSAVFSRGVDLEAAVRGGFDPGPAVAGAVLVASLVAGLPHGAVDIARLDGSWRERAPAATLYLLLVLLAGSAWLLAPMPTLVALLAMSVAHFGAADLELADAAGTSPRSRIPRIGVIAAAGGTPVLVPLALHGSAVLTVLAGLTGGHGAAVVVCCRSALPVVAASAVLVVVDAVRRRRWELVRDLGVLLVLFLVATPLLAFAAYFGLWHAWRQTGLMVRADVRVLAIRPVTALQRLLRHSALPSVLSLAAVAVLVVVGDQAVLTWSLAAVLCLTVPHVAMPLLGRPVAPKRAAGVRRSRPRRRPTMNG